MKLKEIDRTATLAWSPIENHGIYLAAGTAAQQLDCSFNSNSVLELYFFDINTPGLDIPVNATLECESRFYKLVWGSHGMVGSEQRDAEYLSGIIVGGSDNGLMQVYDVAKILKKEDPIVLTKNKHTGPVRALDFNSFRSNIIASGASDSEILIWDLNSPKTAMTPGPRSQPGDEVTSLAWNKQVEHILASSFSNRCVMWDLRKNEPIIKVADSSARVKYVAVEWHPAVATQLCLASDDEMNPTIQLWDLRYATSPIRVMMGHQRGVMGLSWCQQDPDLVVSCGKDSSLKCWNPNYPHQGYELVAEIPTASQWSFDVSFCPKNPLVIASSSFDGRVSVFGLSGGTQQPMTSSKLADSFPGMDMTMDQTPVPAQKPMAIELRDAPKWLKRPCGASFAFGGKLIMFENVKPQQQQQQQGQQQTHESRLVTISQVVTQPEFLAKSQILEAALASGNLGDFCEQKAAQADNAGDGKIWRYLRANFSADPVTEYLSLLGYEPASVFDKLKGAGSASGLYDEVQALTEGVNSLMQGDTFGHLDGSAESETKYEPFAIPTGDDFQGQVNQALLTGNIDSAVGLLVDNSEWSEALILASFGSPDLLRKVQRLYFKRNKCTTDIIQVVVDQDWKKLVKNCQLADWEQALATILTYVRTENLFTELAGLLGQRLQASEDENMRKNSLICYICSGDMDKLAQSWASSEPALDSANSLQNLVEHITVLRKAAEARGRCDAVGTGPLASKIVEYATLLASQGSLDSALRYLSDSSDPSMVQLRERIQYALGYQYQRPRGFVSRSRQTSESSHRGSLSMKRPSTGGGHAFGSPPSSMVNGFGSLSGNAVSQQPVTAQPFVPMAPSVQTGMLGSKPPQPSPPVSSLPRPPVSNVAHGWNDPPPLATVVKPKTKTVAQAQEPITHPFFVPSTSASGFDNISNFPPSAPPPPANFMPPKPLNIGTSSQTVPLFPASGSPGQSSIAPPPTQNSYPAMPPTMPFGGGPQSGYGSHTSFTPAPPPAAAFAPAPPPSSTFTPGPPLSNTFAPAPPPSSALPPPPAAGFKPTSLQSLGIQRSSLPANLSGGPSSSVGGYGGVGSYQTMSYDGRSGQSSYGGHAMQSYSAGPPPMGGQMPILSGPSAHSNSMPSGLPIPSSAASMSGMPPTGSYSTFPPPLSSVGLTSSAPPLGPPPAAMPLTAPATSSFSQNVQPSSGPAFLPGTSVATALPSNTHVSSAFNNASSDVTSGMPHSGSSVNHAESSLPANSSNLLMSAANSSLPPVASPLMTATTMSSNPILPTSPAQLGPPPSEILNAFSPSSAGFQLTPAVDSKVESAAEAIDTSFNPVLPPPASKSPAFSEKNFGQGDSNLVQQSLPSNLPPPPVGMKPTSPSVAGPPVASSPLRTDALSARGGPVSEEHQELLDVLERLRQECLKVAGLPQIKRKLEDIGKKLENLKEKLQCGSLTPSTLISMHEMIEAMKNREYPRALSIHTRLCTSGNMAEISSFMPAIKTLITTAAQLNVFL